MSFYEYLPHEYSYACFLDDHCDIYPWDSMITNIDVCNNLKLLFSNEGLHYGNIYLTIMDSY